MILADLAFLGAPPSMYRFCAFDFACDFRVLHCWGPSILFLTGTASKYLLTPGMCKTLGCCKISSMGTFELAILRLGGPAGSCDVSLLGYFPTPSVLTSCFLLKMQTLWLKNDFKRHFLACVHLFKR